MMMGMPLFGLIALLLSAALLVWVSGQGENPAKKIGKVIAWIGIVLSAIFLIVHLGMCTKMCFSGKCPMTGDRMPGWGMRQKMMMQGMPMQMEEKGDKEEHHD